MGKYEVDTFGGRMKRYEEVTRSILVPRSIYAIRVDGRAFHTYLRDATRPYDYDFIWDMQNVAQEMCREISGTVFAYGQSDEISIIVRDEPRAEPWFGGVVQKIVSISAALATAHLIRRSQASGRGNGDLPTFDSRVFTLPSWMEAANYVIWRQQDAVRNSIQMAGQAVYSPSQLKNVPLDQIQEMLWSEHKINWNDYPEAAKRGWILTKDVRQEPVSYVDKRTSLTETAVVLRTFWRVSSPSLTIDDPLFALLRDDVASPVAS